jgi:protein-S-isoprenylcysteine O-methyltransferase Ste14
VAESGLTRLRRSIASHGVAGSLRVLGALGLVLALVTLSKPTPASVAAGVPFVALGLAMRAWAAGHLVKTLELAVSGPYRHVQNPLYFGRLCLLVGFATMAWWPVPLAGRTLPANVLLLLGGLAVFFGYYLPRKRRVEGGRLARLHGEAYTRWARNVPEILPRLRPYGANQRRWDPERFRENGEGLFVLFVSGVVAAFALRALA